LGVMNHLTVLPLDTSQPTLEMDLALWQTAQAVRADPDAAAHFGQTDAETLAAEYIQEQLPEHAQTAVAAFLARYGVRGLAEIDLGRPRWREDPTPVMKGVFSQPDDVCFLYTVELEALAAGEQRDWAHLVRKRRQAYARERLRRQIPQLLLSDGQAFYEGGAGTQQDDEGVITGSPVSPGVVEGTVRVVFDPHGAQLAPGEILVCPGTDPPWTPLFLAASGLVMEVGGMMTHGSVVAREYGIPAVVGVHEATRRLHTGQHIRVDGNSGQIVILASTG
jgi:phosphoenolpyruvate synthase/pyruvate phosphate dikinase